jgi:hypothetical protein
VIYCFGFGVFGAIEQLALMLTMLIALLLKDGTKVDILNFITDRLAILMSISLFFYGLHFAGVSLPYAFIESKRLGYEALNYYWFLLVPNFDEFFRFRSVFAEPGHLSMGLILLLYANRYNLKNKSVLVLFVSQILTLSLAGYIAMFASLFILSFFKASGNPYPRVLLFIGAILLSSIILTSDTESVTHKAITSRLEFDAAKGTITGYNRTDPYVDQYFEDFLQKDELFFGASRGEVSDLLRDGGNAGYKVFLIRFGVIAAIFIVLFFFAAALKEGLIAVGVFIILMLMLYQNSYPFWFAVFSSYIFGVAKLRADGRRTKRNRVC